MFKNILLFALLVIFSTNSIAAEKSKEAEKKVEKKEDKKSKDVAKEKAKEEIKITKEELLQVRPDDFVLGDKKAKVLMIEYSSLTCPHCADFSNKILPELTEKYINTGKMKFVHRDFPLNEPAIRAAMIAKCSGENRYYSFLKAFFQSQKNWAFTRDFKESLKNVAKLGGMNSTKFDECLADKKLEEKILRSRLEAEKALKVESTPTIFINDNKIVGTKSFDTYAAAIEEELKKN